jgi:hypothetical protein
VKLYQVLYSARPLNQDAAGAAVSTFPIDMLRYDASTVADERSSALIERTLRYEPIEAHEHVDLRKLTTIRGWKPNSARWESFGWSVRVEGEREAR